MEIPASDLGEFSMQPPESAKMGAAYRNAMKTFCAPVLRAGDKGCAITCIHAEIGTAEIGRFGSFI